MACVVLCHNTSKYGQGEGNQGVERGDGKDSREGQCTGRPMCQGNCVHPQEDHCDRGGEETSREENATDPRLAIHLEIKSRRDVATNGTCQAVNNDKSSEDGPATCRGDEARQRQSKEEEGGHNELHTSTNRSAEEDGELRETEDIAMNQLPPGLQ